ncbi:MAG: phthiotriol/phenolphthiotriol dimycocerosates methyltransferase [Opitutales bacterium]
MALIDSLFILGPMRKAMWQAWYPFLTHKLRNEDVIFLNYAYEESPTWEIPLSDEDEPNRACIQLYHHTASQIDLSGKTVLEVSCGHGGGASYIKRTLGPAQYTGLDLNPKGIAFCQRRHAIDGLKFIQGDAQSLPFPNASLDAIVNVEASHCYPSFPKFLEEVNRVLKPGGSLLYADFRFSDRFEEWDSAIEASPLKVITERNISPQVLNGMNINSERSKDLVERLLPKFLHGPAADFAGIEGSRIYESLKSGDLVYKSYHFQKA